MSTPILTNNQQAAFNILNALKTQGRDVSALSETEKQTLLTEYTQDQINCYSPLRIPKNKSCCNRNFSKPIKTVNIQDIKVL
jgi:hypothetical protein